VGKEKSVSSSDEDIKPVVTKMPYGMKGKGA
jgi:hypothetical protein